MATFTIAPDFGARCAYKPRLLEARFGDGYSQRTADGINSLAESWALTFSSRTPAEAAVVRAFLSAHAAGLPFDWTSPAGTVGRWVCREWSFQPDTAASQAITATFEQDFAP